MPHLVEPIRPLSGRQISIPECRDRIVNSHRYLKENGQVAVRKAERIDSASDWGSQVKRIPVLLPSEDRPVGIGEGLTEHSLPEVITQCANIERLIDVFEWLEGVDNPLRSARVLICHPTSSGGTRKLPESDLELDLGDGMPIRFEVTDVTGTRDGNNKERDSLIALGFLKKDATLGNANNSLADPNGRGFIAASDGLAQVMMKLGRWWRTPPVNHIRYSQPIITSGTLNQ